ncbi:hypothetical protein J6590_012982 [Homalodisca vitripennis]|nr:hypothetical protein J6590_012982 [Homalodisca vitripennis]
MTAKATIETTKVSGYSHRKYRYYWTACAVMISNGIETISGTITVTGQTVVIIRQFEVGPTMRFIKPINWTRADTMAADQDGGASSPGAAGTDVQ